MLFKEIFKEMKENGAKAKLPSWGGYWYWDAEKETIMMRTKDDKLMDIRKTEAVEYTTMNICSDEWIFADETNCPVLGGEATFSFSDAIRYLKRGLKVARKGWNGKGIYIEMQTPDSHSKMTLPYIYIVASESITDGSDVSKSVVPWFASQADMLAEDWVFAK